MFLLHPKYNLKAVSDNQVHYIKKINTKNWNFNNQ